MNLNQKTGKAYLLQGEGSKPLSVEHFDPMYWSESEGYQVIDGGRGGSFKINIDGVPAVLKLYFRGGLVSKLISKHYLWFGKNRTRPWREWTLLEYAHAAELPVPEPIGVCAIRNGLMYQAALITRYIKNTETLADRLKKSALSKKSWKRLGVLIKQFQQLKIRHADLNATNILIDDQEKFYIIDFDKGRLMKRVDDWQWQPLYRLQRSLEKIDRREILYYRSSDWQSFMDGYQA